MNLLHCPKRYLLTLFCLSFTVMNGIQADEESASVTQEETREVPTDFVRDVMQPLGMPVVSFYHAVRESLFFNTRISEANPLEEIGNFFLTPSRYLFAGKKIHIEQKDDAAQYVVKQSYSYKKLHWLKSLGSFVALPVSYTVGTTFKAISYLFPEVRRRQRAIKRTLHASCVESHLEQYTSQGIPAFHSEESIPCQHHKRPSGLTKKQKIEIQTLKEITALLDQHQILYWIDCGTCLGAYRYGGIIPWDWDIDLAIMVDDHENVKNILAGLDPEKYQIQDWSSYSKPKTFLKLFVKETKNFVDIYHYKIDEKEQTVGYVFTYIDSPFPQSWKKSELKCIKPLAYEQVFPLKKATFDNLTVWAPHNIVEFLQSKYGENLDPTMVWNEESQTYDKVVDHPFYQ